MTVIQIIITQVEYPSSKILGTRNFSDFGLFRVLNIYIDSMKDHGNASKSKHIDLFFIYTQPQGHFIKYLK